MATPTNTAKDLGEIKGILKMLVEKVDHNCKASVEGDEKILSAINVWTEKHEIYHKGNEERWGVFAYLRNHMKTTVITCVIVGIGLASLLGVTIPKILEYIKYLNGAIR